VATAGWVCLSCGVATHLYGEIAKVAVTPEIQQFQLGKHPLLTNLNKKGRNAMKEVMAKYGMEMLGPPIFASSWMQQH
jgi:hypothetical protein